MFIQQTVKLMGIVNTEIKSQPLQVIVEGESMENLTWKKSLAGLRYSLLPARQQPTFLYRWPKHQWTKCLIPLILFRLLVH